jgi:hypothetical protein
MIASVIKCLYVRLVMLRIRPISVYNKCFLMFIINVLTDTLSRISVWGNGGYARGLAVGHHVGVARLVPPLAPLMILSRFHIILYAIAAPIGATRWAPPLAPLLVLSQFRIICHRSTHWRDQNGATIGTTAGSQPIPRYIICHRSITCHRSTNWHRQIGAATSRCLYRRRR